MSRGVATSGVTSTVSPPTAERRPPAITNFEPHAGEAPYSQNPSAGLVWAQEATACSRHEVCPGFNPTSGLLASGEPFSIAGNAAGRAAPVRRDLADAGCRSTPRRGANGRRPWACACPTLDDMGKDTLLRTGFGSNVMC